MELYSQKEFSIHLENDTTPNELVTFVQNQLRKIALSESNNEFVMFENQSLPFMKIVVDFNKLLTHYNNIVCFIKILLISKTVLYNTNYSSVTGMDNFEYRNQLIHNAEELVSKYVLPIILLSIQSYYSLKTSDVSQQKCNVIVMTREQLFNILYTKKYSLQTDNIV